MKWSVTWALALVVVGSALVHAAPRKGAKGQNASAKTVDVLKAVTDKQVNAQVTVQGLTSATLTLTNLGEEPLNVKVPLALAAVPQAPPGANQQYYLGAFGTPGAPQPVAIAVSPVGSAGVNKKARKTGVKTSKKKGDDEAKEEKKDDDKDDAKKSDENSLEASVLLPPGGSHPLALLTMSLDNKKPQAAYGTFALSELAKVSESAEMKWLLEKVSQGTVRPNLAQPLAWHYHLRRTWDEMVKDGLVTQFDLQNLEQAAAVVEGKAAPTTTAATGKKKKKTISDE